MYKILRCKTVFVGLRLSPKGDHSMFVPHKIRATAVMIRLHFLLSPFTINILKMSNILRFLQTDHDTNSSLFSFITKGSCATKPSVVADNVWRLDQLRDLPRKSIVTAFHQVTLPLLSLLGHCLRNKTYCNNATVFRVERSASTVCNDKHSLVAREISS